MKKTIYTLLFFIIVHSLLKIEDCKSQTGWFSQPLPVSGQVQDLKFIDANTGFISMNPAITLRTTNGGYNWNYILTNQYVGNFEIIDSNTIYANGMNASAYGILFRTYNRGATWDSLPVANSWTVNGISFVNRDTGWVGGTSGGLPYLWRTTNAGLNWTVQSDNTGFGKVFFLKEKVNGEYVGWSMNYSSMWKTTNSGVSWVQLLDIGSNVTKLFFKNQITGYAANYNCLEVTTNGGLNWISHFLPSDSGVFYNQMNYFDFVNEDTLYGDNGSRYFGNGIFRGVIWISTNGGVTWGFQQPDTAIHKNRYNGIDFSNNSTGWSSWIRTNDGGGPIIIAGINTFITERPSSYTLEQNYPNPFNPATRINFSIPSPSFVTLTVYDITGKEILKIYKNEFFTSGNYFAAIDIGKMNLASGLYFYRMTATGRDGSIDFSRTKKMLYIK
ncbi:MAG: YCF48-related protein [Ignavibacteria bacterium]